MTSLFAFGGKDLKAAGLSVSLMFSVLFIPFRCLLMNIGPDLFSNPSCTELKHIYRQTRVCVQE